MTTEISHKLPGEHVYDGILFFGYTPPDILDAVKDFEVRDDDVFIVTYPKAGNVPHDGSYIGLDGTSVIHRKLSLNMHGQ